MIKIIVDVNIPEGATHYVTHNDTPGYIDFYKYHSDGSLMNYSIGEWYWDKWDMRYGKDIIEQTQREMKPIIKAQND